MILFAGKYLIMPSFFENVKFAMEMTTNKTLYL